MKSTEESEINQFDSKIEKSSVLISGVGAKSCKTVSPTRSTRSYKICFMIVSSTQHVNRTFLSDFGARLCNVRKRNGVQYAMQFQM